MIFKATVKSHWKIKILQKLAFKISVVFDMMFRRNNLSKSGNLSNGSHFTGHKPQLFRNPQSKDLRR